MNLIFGRVKNVALVCFCFAVLTAASAQGGLITSDPGGGVTTTFTTTGNNGFGNPGPVVLDGIVVTGNPQATYGNSGYGLGSNGGWSFSWVATNNGNGTVTFDLGGLASFVGGFVNYAPGFGSNATIEALGVGMNVLESYDLTTLAPISTPGGNNAGAFRGIQRPQGDIAFFRIGGNFILTHDLTIGAAPVPEPASLAIWGGLGLVGLFAARRRRLKQTASA